MYEIVGSTEVTIPGLLKPLSPPKKITGWNGFYADAAGKVELVGHIIYAASHHILIRYTHRTCEIFLVGG